MFSGSLLPTVFQSWVFLIVETGLWLKYEAEDQRWFIYFTEVFLKILVKSHLKSKLPISLFYILILSFRHFNKHFLRIFYHFMKNLFSCLSSEMHERVSKQPLLLFSTFRMCTHKHSMVSSPKILRVNEIHVYCSLLL